MSSRCPRIIGRPQLLFLHDRLEIEIVKKSRFEIHVRNPTDRWTIVPLGGNLPVVRDMPDVGWKRRSCLGVVLLPVLAPLTQGFRFGQKGLEFNPTFPTIFRAVCELAVPNDPARDLERFLAGPAFPEPSGHLQEKPAAPTLRSTRRAGRGIAGAVSAVRQPRIAFEPTSRTSSQRGLKTLSGSAPKRSMMRICRGYRPIRADRPRHSSRWNPDTGAGSKHRHIHNS